MKKLIEILQKPFREHFIFLISLFVFITSPYLLLQTYVNTLHFNDLLITIHCFVLSYLVTLIVSLIKSNKLRKVIQCILMVVFGIDFIINILCVLQFGYMIDGDVLMLIVGTDINEAKEFASSILSAKVLLTIISIILVFLALWRLTTKKNLNLGKKMSMAAMGFAVLCIAGNIYTWGVWQDGPIHWWNERWNDVSTYEVPDKLQSFYSHPSVTFVEDNQMPSNIILIIGESFARSHSSLYGYDKPTNPQLGAVRDSSFLFALDSVDSPAATTALSIRYMLSLCSKEDEEKSDKRWFEYISIVELMQECGYGCYWFGNQARSSIHNGATRVFAEACDRQWFLQQEGSDNFNVRLDQILVDSSYHFASQLKPEQHSFIIYHMMGSHFKFDMRYPQDFAKFTEKDYLTEPESHRNLLSIYDNSILYNDFIVNEIINLYKDKESLVIYLPDHGQVMYRDPDKPDYFAHGNDNNPVSYGLGVEIPFLIYASPEFQQNHPDIMQRIKARQSDPKRWNSDDLPYFIMDLIGVTAVNGESIADKSILN